MRNSVLIPGLHGVHISDVLHIMQFIRAKWADVFNRLGDIEVPIDTLSLAEVRDLLGEDKVFIDLDGTYGADNLKKKFDQKSYTKLQALIANARFSRAEIEAMRRGGEILSLVPRLTLKEIVQYAQPRIRARLIANELVNNQRDFYKKQTPNIKQDFNFCAINLDVPGARSKDYLEQTLALVDYLRKVIYIQDNSPDFNLSKIIIELTRAQFDLMTSIDQENTNLRIAKLQANRFQANPAVLMHLRAQKLIADGEHYRGDYGKCLLNECVVRTSATDRDRLVVVSGSSIEGAEINNLRCGTHPADTKREISIASCRPIKTF